MHAIDRSANAASGAGMSVGAVKRIVREFFAYYRGNIPLDVDVAASQESLFGPQASVQNVGTIKGAFYPARKALALAAASLRDRADVVLTLRHEVVGHFGLLTLLPQDKRAVLDKIIESRHTARALGQVWRRVERDYPEPKQELSKAARSRFVDMQAEEVFAVAAQAPRPSVFGQAWVEVKALVAKGLRAVRLIDDAITMPEVDALVQAIGRGIRNGTARQQIFPTSDDAQFARTDERVFCSALTQTVERAAGAPRVADAVQWAQWLDGAQRRGEVRQAERDWVGVDAWLQDQSGPIPRQALIDYVRAHEIELGEVIFGNDRKRSELSASEDAEWLDLHSKSYERELSAEERARFEELDRRTEQVTTWRAATTYERYQAPGGFAYRELVLTLAGPAAPVPAFDRSHLEVDNALLHVRFNEREDSEGRRILLIEELQSDLHQLGRKHGYRAAPSSDGGPGEHDDCAVPDAPFKATSDWAMLGMKRMLRFAVEHDFDRLAWTTGAMQAERYDLRKRIDWLDYRRNADGTFDVETTGIEFGGGDGASRVSLAHVESLYGKDIADRMSRNAGSQAPEGTGFERRLSGDLLAVGTTGLEGFYDTILPSVMNRFAKRFGSSVVDGEILVLTATEVEPDIFGNYEIAVGGFGTDVAKVHAIDITPAMREAVLREQPMFRREASAPAEVSATFTMASAAFDDIGRPVEAAQVLRQAAAMVAVGAVGDLRDTNGEIVGRVGRAVAGEEVARDDSTVLQVTVAPGDERAVADAIEAAALRVSVGEREVPVATADGRAVGRVIFRPAVEAVFDMWPEGMEPA